MGCEFGVRFVGEIFQQSSFKRSQFVAVHNIMWLVACLCSPGEEAEAADMGSG